MVNYILTATGTKKLTYIGHSQGTVQALAAFSTNQPLSEQINLFIGLVIN